MTLRSATCLQNLSQTYPPAWLRQSREYRYRGKQATQWQGRDKVQQAPNQFQTTRRHRLIGHQYRFSWVAEIHLQKVAP